MASRYIACRRDIRSLRLKSHGMVDDVFMQVGQAKQEFQDSSALGFVMHASLVRQRLHNEMRFRQQPFEVPRIERVRLLAHLQSLFCSGRSLVEEMVEAKVFASKSGQNALAATVYTTGSQFCLFHLYAPGGSYLNVKHCKRLTTTWDLLGDANEGLNDGDRLERVRRRTLSE
jgi:hypothetical protein